MGIHEAETEGRMYKLIQNFHKPRPFKVKVNEIRSDTKVQTEGIRQRSVVIPTFFTLKINKIVAKLPIDKIYQLYFYMYDLQISYRHQDLKVVERKLKDSTKIVKKFTQKNGFKFSTSKTSMLHITKLSIPPPIDLRLGNN